VTSIPGLYIWKVVETAGFESAWLSIDRRKLRARGRAVGQLPQPYTLDYELETDDEAATKVMDIIVETTASQHRLSLRREASRWSVNGDERPDLAVALDCDLAGSPVTNTMPIIRHGFQCGLIESHAFLTAFVQVPTLSVVAAKQTYTYLSHSDEAARIRYASGSFVQELIVDGNGVVVDYPTMARRVRAHDVITDSERTSGPGSLRPGASN
jgi:hypothetical protein